MSEEQVIENENIIQENELEKDAEEQVIENEDVSPVNIEEVEEFSNALSKMGSPVTPEEYFEKYDTLTDEEKTYLKGSKEFVDGYNKLAKGNNREGIDFVELEIKDNEENEKTNIENKEEYNQANTKEDISNILEINGSKVDISNMSKARIASLIEKGLAYDNAYKGKAHYEKLKDFIDKNNALQVIPFYNAMKDGNIDAIVKFIRNSKISIETLTDKLSDENFTPNYKADKIDLSTSDFEDKIYEISQIDKSGKFIDAFFNKLDNSSKEEIYKNPSIVSEVFALHKKGILKEFESKIIEDDRFDGVPYLKAIDTLYREHQDWLQKENKNKSENKKPQPKKVVKKTIVKKSSSVSRQHSDNNKNIKNTIPAKYMKILAMNSQDMSKAIQELSMQELEEFKKHTNKKG